VARFARVLVVVGFLLLLPFLTFAQDITPTPAAPAGVQTVVPVTPLDFPTPTLEVTLTPEIAATSAPSVGLDVPILISARSDIELLASQALGGNSRPPGWSGSLDINDPNLALLLRLDLEILTTVLLKTEERPDGWFGAVASTPYAVARDIRHDLELLADNVLEMNVRPPGWAGDAPLMRCDRSTQNLVALLERGGVFTLNVDASAPDYCVQAAVAAGKFTEANLLQNSANGTGGADVIQSAQNTNGATSGSVNGGGTEVFIPAGRIAPIGGDIVTPAFLDRYATQQVGYIPVAVTFSPVARSYTQFSNMVVVRGANFEVFVDYKTTTLAREQFEDLPDIDRGQVTPFCDADWCTEVLITTGAGGGGSVSPGGRRIVSVDNINYGYDGGDEGNTTLVRLSLCPNPRPSADCEPVTQVILPDGKPARPVSRVNGENQWRLPIGHSFTSLRSRSYYTAELWINYAQYR
jgi:hypothetical protein